MGRQLQPTQARTVSTIVFSTPHGLTPGQGITSGGEIRFVASVTDTLTVVLNAPFSVAPVLNAPIGQMSDLIVLRNNCRASVYSITGTRRHYRAEQAKCGAAVDGLTVKLNGDFHQFEFKGTAQDLIDSSSFLEAARCTNDVSRGTSAR